MRKLAIITAAALSALAAIGARGEVGSVISSFQWPGARNVYRDADYAYSVASPNTLRAYTLNGSLVNSVNLAGLNDAGDADHSVLGGAYLAVLAGKNTLRDYVISTGSLARSVPVPDCVGYAYIPGGAYMYVATGAYVHRYTTAGSLVSSFRILGPYIGGIAGIRNRRGLDLRLGRGDGVYGGRLGRNDFFHPRYDLRLRLRAGVPGLFRDDILVQFGLRRPAGLSAGPRQRDGRRACLAGPHPGVVPLSATSRRRLCRGARLRADKGSVTAAFSLWAAPY